MDASPLPVLTRWTEHASDGETPPRNLPDAMPRVAGLARSPGEALRRAADAWPGRDVLLMHADARLPPDGWRRLSAAWRDGDWDVLSPAAAAIDAQADEQAATTADAIAWTHAEHATFASARVATYCSLWRGGHVGDGAAGAAPARRGWLPCVAVAAAGAASDTVATTGDGDEDGDVGTGRPAHPHEDVVLHVLHGWGGGAERFVRDLVAGDAGRTHLVLVAHNRDDRPPLGERLALYHDLDAAPLREWLLAEPIADTAEESAEVRAILADLLPEWGIGAVLVSSLIGHSLDVLRTGLPTALCTHDAYPLWPLLHDERDPHTDAFDGASLAAGLAADPASPFRGRDAAGWRRLRDTFLATLDEADILLVAPSRFARERICAIEPELREHRWQLIGHGLAPFAPATVASVARGADAPLRVLVPGRIHGGKGERLLDAMIGTLPAGVELVLLGAGREGARFAGDRVQVIPDYDRDTLPDWIHRLAPDVALLPSTVPETFGYTLSEMLALRVPVLCASPGAPVERLAATGGGWAVPAHAGAVNAALARLAGNREELAVLRAAPAPAVDDVQAMADAWRLALSVAPSTLRLPPADAITLRLRAAERRARRLAHRARRQHDELVAARAELDTRAEWAHDLQAQVDRARKQIDESQLELDRRAAWAGGLNLQLEQARTALADSQAELARRAQWALGLKGELDQAQASLAGAVRRHDAALAELDALRRAAADATDERYGDQVSVRRLRADAEERELELGRLEDYIRELDHQLAEAHGYYQRDSTDLARQRDVAVAQRDQANAELARIRASMFWRISAWPRAIASGIRNRLLAGVYHGRYLRQLAGRGLNSLRMRGLAGTLKRMRERRGTTASDSSGAKPLPLASGADELRVPQARAPRASIIVPVYNQLHLSLACLRALADCGDRTGFEVIVVDDGSSDASQRLLPSIPGVRYHRNARNLGFIGACNTGAELARGQFLVFLNNDTTVQPGWLDALLATFVAYPDTGLAGSKLVYPDGRLQEAGGIVFADGSGWNYERFADPSHPRFGFVREVDYCSGAAIALPRELFMRLGGFDMHYAPAYYEDTDLAMRVRQEGLKVRYQPASVVVHHEGGTAGTDIREGVKAYQVANHAKFLERWAETLRTSHMPPGSDPEVAADRSRGVGRGPRVLVLDACTPTPDRDSGSMRMFALMRVLRQEGCSVVFFPENRAHDGRYTEALQQEGIEAWWHPHIADVPRWLTRHGAQFDLVIASRHYVLGPLLPLLRRHAPRAHLVFDTVDLHHLREQRQAELGDDPAQWRTAARTRRAELALIRQADTTWVVSEAERRLLADEVPEARIEVVSNIHDVQGPGPGWHEREGLLFVGSYRHPPNVDAARWLVAEILPRVRARLPDVVLHLVGGDAPDEVRALGQQPGVTFHDYVPDLLPLLESARVGLAPLRYGAGVKGKVNQALAHGLPVVATRCGVEGMHLVEGEDVLIADEAATFADAVVRLYGDEALWRRLAEGGLENTRRHFSTDTVRTTLRTLLDTLPRA